MIAHRVNPVMNKLFSIRCAVFSAAIFSLIGLSLVSVPAEAAEKSSPKAKTSTASATKAKVVKVGAKSKKKSSVSARNGKLRQIAKYNKRKSISPNAIDPEKHAALVIDADSGKVIYAENATAVRHPASLTKMMTLYLTFDAIEKGKLGWNKMLPVSDEAASQAPTNLSLEAGDTIAVKDAVYGLIIRSANDAAVVLAEAISGSEEEFAKRMTQKARALGMANTRFVNASGLPDVRQVTTARDMAVMGLALKKHFPEFYSMFKARSFSFNGRTYDTHNRVMLRYAGVDGLKTGFTRMSGFNLVTSVNRDGRRLIGVVMGGITGKSRDDRMITILDQSYRKLASGGTSPNISVASSVSEASSAEVSEGQGDTDEKTHDAYSGLRDSSKSTYIRWAASAKELASKADQASGIKAGTQSAASESRKTVSGASTASAGQQFDPSAVKGLNWGIQVGAFDKESEAKQAALNAKRMVSELAELSKVVVMDNQDYNNRKHRARLENLSQNQAQKACNELKNSNNSCFVYRADAE